MVLDFGAHLYPTSVIPEPIANGPLSDLLGDTLSNPGTLRQIYHEAGVDAAALSQPYYMGHADANAVATANDALLEVIRSTESFYGLAAIPVAAGGESAAAEFERSLEAGYHGGALETKTDGIELDDRELEPVFEVANSTGAPILVHPKLSESLHPDVLTTHRLNAIFGRETALSESICKVIHGGILKEYPDLHLVYHHLGGNLASMLGRVHLQLDRGRWPGDGDVVDYTTFKSALDSRIYFDTSGFFGYEAPVRTALEEFPSSRILFGTDYPFEPRDAEEVSRFAETIEDVAGNDADEILERNALDLLINT